MQPNLVSYQYCFSSLSYRRLNAYLIGIELRFASDPDDGDDSVYGLALVI